MPHTKSLSSRTFWNASGSLVASMSRMVAAIVIARQLGPESMGNYAFLSWMVEFTIIILSYGLPNTLTRYLAELSGQGDETSKRNLVRWITRRYFALVLFGFVGVYAVVTIFLSDIASTEIALLISTLLLLQALSGLIGAYLAGNQDFRKIAKINVFSGIALVVLQPTFVFLMGLPGALLGVAASYAVSLIWLKPLISEAFNDEISVVPDSLTQYAFYTWLAALVSAVVWARTELYFLTQYSTLVQAGYFSASLTIVSFVTIGAGLLTGALMPHFSTAVGGGDRFTLQRDYARLTILVAMFSLPVSLGGIAVMRELISFMFGAAYTEATATASVLMATGILAFAGVGSSLLYASGQSNFIFRYGIVGAVLLVGGCYLTAPVYGALGTAMIRLAVQVLMIVIGTLFIHRRLAIIPPYRALLRIGLAATLSALVAKTTLEISAIFPLIWAIITGGVSYLLFLRLLNPLTEEDVLALLRPTRYLPAFGQRYARSFIRWVFHQR